MFGSIPLSKKKAYSSLCLVGLFIFICSIEALLITKDVSAFEKWYNLYNADNLPAEKMFSIFISEQVIRYLFFIMVPIAYGIQTYLAFTKTRINSMYIAVWGMFLVCFFLLLVFSFELYSPFYYLKILNYCAIILVLFSYAIDIKKFNY